MGAALAKLPDLFGRNFAIGFLLPALLLLVGVWFTLDGFAVLPPALAFAKVDDLADTAIVFLATWLTAIALVAINRPLVQTLEGYTFENWPVLRRLKGYWRRRYAKTAAPAIAKQAEVDAARAKGDPDPPVPDDHADRLLAAVTRFPHATEWILPTRFGNRYRAIETYCHAVYGIDAIPAWGRLQAVLPENFQATIDDARAQLNFAVNLQFAGILSLVVWLVLAANTQFLPAIWPPAVFIAIAVIGHIISFSALDQYGQTVKSAFDLYRGALAEQLGLDLPRNPESEREMWTEVNRMLVYRSAAAYGRLTKFKKHRGDA